MDTEVTLNAMSSWDFSKPVSVTVICEDSDEAVPVEDNNNFHECPTPKIHTDYNTYCKAGLSERQGNEKVDQDLICIKTEIKNKRNETKKETEHSDYSDNNNIKSAKRLKIMQLQSDEMNENICNNKSTDKNLQSVTITSPLDVSVSKRAIIKENQALDTSKKKLAKPKKDTYIEEINQLFHDLLLKVSESLIRVIQAYQAHIQNTITRSRDLQFKQDSKQRYLLMKNHFFQLSYCTTSTIIIPRENDVDFTDRFLNHTIELAAQHYIKLTVKQLKPFYYDLLSWVKKKNLTTVPVSPQVKKKLQMDTPLLSQLFKQTPTELPFQNVLANSSPSLNHYSESSSINDGEIRITSLNERNETITLYSNVIPYTTYNETASQSASFLKNTRLPVITNRNDPIATNRNRYNSIDEGNQQKVTSEPGINKDQLMCYERNDRAHTTCQNTIQMSNQISTLRNPTTNQDTVNEGNQQKVTWKPGINTNQLMYFERNDRAQTSYQNTIQKSNQNSKARNPLTFQDTVRQRIQQKITSKPSINTGQLMHLERNDLVHTSYQNEIQTFNQNTIQTSNQNGTLSNPTTYQATVDKGNQQKVTSEPDIVQSMYFVRNDRAYTSYPYTRQKFNQNNTVTNPTIYQDNVNEGNQQKVTSEPDIVQSMYFVRNDRAYTSYPYTRQKFNQNNTVTNPTIYQDNVNEGNQQKVTFEPGINKDQLMYYERNDHALTSYENTIQSSYQNSTVRTPTLYQDTVHEGNKQKATSEPGINTDQLMYLERNDLVHTSYQNTIQTSNQNGTPSNPTTYQATVDKGNQQKVTSEPGINTDQLMYLERNDLVHTSYQNTIQMSNQNTIQTSNQNGTLSNPTIYQATVDKVNQQKVTSEPGINTDQLMYFKHPNNVSTTSSSVSTDSGFASPQDIMLSPVDEEMQFQTPMAPQTTPLITYVTSLNPKAWPISQGSCHVCCTLTRRKCLGCCRVYYCNYNCQKYDWSRHIADCTNTTQR